jgi:hypothetical protein
MNPASVISLLTGSTAVPSLEGRKKNLLSLALSAQLLNN